MLCADGKPVMFGETLYGGDGRDWMIVGIAGEWSYDVYGLHVAHDGKKEKKPLRAEWLVHELTDAGRGLGKGCCQQRSSVLGAGACCQRERLT